MDILKILNLNVKKISFDFRIKKYLHFFFLDDGATLACFYSSMALNRELCSDAQMAFKYHRKALELWQNQ